MAASTSLMVSTLFLRLAQEEETLQARTRAEDLERENLDLAANLAKKEQEMDLRVQEKVCEH